MDHFPDPAALRALPAIIIGAGPIGLACAAHFVAHNEPFLLLEAGDAAGASVRAWGHVSMFTPMRYNVDPTARQLLNATGWTIEDNLVPTGQQLVNGYLQPLAELPAIAAQLRLQHRVTHVGRLGGTRSLIDRENTPFVVRCETPAGPTSVVGRAVIDASGTWASPNELIPGLPLTPEVNRRILSGVPDVRGRERSVFAGKRCLVVGSGHSAMGTVTDLTRLAAESPGTTVTWAVRRDDIETIGPCEDRILTERTLLRRGAHELISHGEIDVRPGTFLTDLTWTDDGIRVDAIGGPVGRFDVIVNATGVHPDHRMNAELWLDLHPVWECVYPIAELIDPARVACGTAELHGVDRLECPEGNFFVLGAKSYGRAGTFLMWAGYEQARSVVAALCGDEAATTPGLSLPESGLCAACDAFTAACACDDDPSATCCDDDDEEPTNDVRA